MHVNARGVQPIRQALVIDRLKAWPGARPHQARPRPVTPRRTAASSVQRSAASFFRQDRSIYLLRGASKTSNLRGRRCASDRLCFWAYRPCFSAAPSSRQALRETLILTRAQDMPARPTRRMGTRRVTLALATSDQMNLSVEAAIGLAARIGTPTGIIDTRAGITTGAGTKHRPGPKRGSSFSSRRQRPRPHKLRLLRSCNGQPNSGLHWLLRLRPPSNSNGLQLKLRRPKLCKNGPKRCNRCISRELKC